METRTLSIEETGVSALIQINTEAIASIRQNTKHFWFMSGGLVDVLDVILRDYIARNYVSAYYSNADRNANSFYTLLIESAVGLYRGEEPLLPVHVNRAIAIAEIIEDDFVEELDRVMPPSEISTINQIIWKNGAVFVRVSFL